MLMRTSQRNLTDIRLPELDEGYKLVQTQIYNWLGMWRVKVSTVSSLVSKGTLVLFVETHVVCQYDISLIYASISLSLTFVFATVTYIFDGHIMVTSHLYVLCMCLESC